VISHTVLVAPDAFKGKLSATRVARAIERGLCSNGSLTVDLCPVADGGEGTAELLLEALGGSLTGARVRDPLGRWTKASFGLLADGRTAVVEVAKASGLQLLSERERDPFGASSQGTGELILTALASGANTVLLAAGGSASTDGGAGAIRAIKRAGGLGGATLVVLCDVRSSFEQAPALYGPQKGADAPTVARLHRRLSRMAARLPRDPRGIPLTGAAGGLAGGLWAVFAAKLVPGATHLMDALGFQERLFCARAVVVGEGRMDRSTLEGKVAFEIATRARQGGVPAYAVTAENALDSFDARIMDLQVILQATDERSLAAAGRKLARLV
jgi:glycerate kinase